MRLPSIRLLVTTTMAIPKKDSFNEDPSRPSSAINDSTPTARSMKRILCLHGRSQSGAILSNKIAGARKKLQRIYELDFLDGPVLLPSSTMSDGGGDQNAIAPSEALAQYAWWIRDESTGRHVGVKDAFDYVMDRTQGKSYDAVLGFSQGGLLGTALALSGALPNVQAVVTAGSPYVEEPFLVAQEFAVSSGADDSSTEAGRQIPKLHFAGETDAMISVESTRNLSNEGGNGRLIVHEKGHLFPTKAAHVNEMLDFLEDALKERQCG